MANDVRYTGSVAFEDTATFSGNVTFSGDMIIKGNLFVNSEIIVTGDVVIMGSLQSTTENTMKHAHIQTMSTEETLDVGDKLNVKGNCTIGEDCIVNYGLSVAGSGGFGKDAIVGGNITCKNLNVFNPTEERFPNIDISEDVEIANIMTAKNMQILSTFKYNLGIIETIQNLIIRIINRVDYNG